MGAENRKSECTDAETFIASRVRLGHVALGLFLLFIAVGLFKGDTELASKIVGAISALFGILIVAAGLEKRYGKKGLCPYCETELEVVNALSAECAICHKVVIVKDERLCKVPD